jgi:hypothetical protein
MGLSQGDRVGDQFSLLDHQRHLAQTALIDPAYPSSNFFHRTEPASLARLPDNQQKPLTHRICALSRHFYRPLVLSVAAVMERQALSV